MLDTQVAEPPDYDLPDLPLAPAVNPWDGQPLGQGARLVRLTARNGRVGDIWVPQESAVELADAFIGNAGLIRVEIVQPDGTAMPRWPVFEPVDADTDRLNAYAEV